jgi:hypothetical protein
MRKPSIRFIFAAIIAVAVFIAVSYGLRATVQEIQQAGQDNADTSSFLQIVPPSTLTENNSVFDALMVPFVNEARKRRADLAQKDPDYFKRVDRELNEGRINFLLFGYGETHEPPITEKAIIGSQTILSYDLRTHRIDVVSFTHDIRAPEIERELARRGIKSAPVRIDQAYNVGGFKLMRQVIEDATGLAIDFQITFRDSVLQGLVDSVFQGVPVDVPETFDVHPFYLDGKKYDTGHFDQGVQKMSGRQVIQFIKTVPVAEGMYDKTLEHNARKSLVFEAILNHLAKNYSDRGLWLRGSAFVAGELVSGAIVYDFDPLPLIVNNVSATTASLSRTNATGESVLPKINRSKYIVDAAQGDGGVQWVTANAAHNPITKRDIDSGLYQTLDMEVPITANPYGDLPTEYWTSVRTLVKISLTTPAESAYNSYTE